ncbi:hypothetical protein [Enterococcus phage vB_EfKS5]|nr:hypothetical protein [Enterococcus phage vB_EfKS5]
MELATNSLTFGIHNVVNDGTLAKVLTDLIGQVM